MFLTMFFKTQNIGQTMHLTMLIAHPWVQDGGATRQGGVALCTLMQWWQVLPQAKNKQMQKQYALYSDNQVLLWSALVLIHNAMQGIYANEMKGADQKT